MHLDWIRHSPDDAAVERLQVALDCHPVVAAVLVNRGLSDPVEARRFLDPSLDALHDPALLPDMTPAVQRIETAIEDDETITVFADRDVDGIMGAVILLTTLQDLGATVGYVVPGKWDGYGLSSEAVDTVAERGTDLLLTVDCGTCAQEAIREANTRGIEVVVLDHHAPDPTLPSTVACINPRRADSRYPHSELAGAAVAYKLGEELGHGSSRERYLDTALPLAALATVGDRMSLQPENRALVCHGYERLHRCPLSGIAQTAAHCDVTSIRDLAWSLVPLLNAAQEAESGDLMLKLALAQDAARIESLIEQLETYRAERREQRQARSAHLEACLQEQVDDGDDLLMVQTDQYVGSVAMSRVSERYHKPVITYRSDGDGYRGGARSDQGIDLLGLLDACDDLLEQTWGHPGAAGFAVDGEHLETFRTEITQRLHHEYDQDDLRPSVTIAMCLTNEDLTRELLAAIERLRPFGTGNEEPEFLIQNVTIEGIEHFGDRGQHIRYRTPAGGIGFVSWHGPERLQGLEYPALVDIVGKVASGGPEETLTVSVTDIRQADSAYHQGRPTGDP